MNMQDRYSDAQVIEHILAGETALYEIIIRRYNSYLYKIGRSYGYSHDDTQDLMQETFIDAYRNLKGFEGRSELKTWVIRIMLNHCYRKKKKPAFRNEITVPFNENDEPLFSGSNNNTQIAVRNKELSQILESALIAIPLEYKMVFSLRELNGLSVSETAKALDISESNVKVRMNRARAMLRKEIEKKYSAEDIFEFNLVYCDAIVADVMEKINRL